mgnify:CR=1 FL=1
MQGNAVLKTCNLRRNNIGDEGATAIGEALRGNTGIGVLKSIDLYGIPDLSTAKRRAPRSTRTGSRRSRRGGDVAALREGSDSRCGERAGRVRAQGVSVA